MGSTTETDKHSSDMKNERIEILQKVADGELTPEQADEQLLGLSIVSNWVAYDWNNIDSRPPKYGKYFVHRKDGKVHWETWNGIGWAYNEKVITHWQEVKPPCC